MAKKLLRFDELQPNPLIDNCKDEVKELSKKDIAIIGMSFRLPLGNDISELWENISAGVDNVIDFPEERRHDADDYLSFRGMDLNEVKYTKGAYIHKIDEFDYSFFRLTPKEASLMTPQQRIFLETAWNAIEDAGYGGNRLRGSNTAVYVGYTSDIEGFRYKDIIYDVDPGLLPISATGNLSPFIASRISYILDLKGPCISVDTACSSSLVAVDTACKAIRNGTCEMALAGGIRINLLPLDKECYKLGIESSDGMTRTFDDSASGSGTGEGAVALLLKPLYKAIENRDHIYAVIKGGAVNQDGTSVGITAPNSAAQTDVLLRAWKDSEIDPGTISYIEAHGTGTALGDPIEVDSLSSAFKKYTDRKQFCAIGSVKSNIGHLYDCAGITGLLKAVLALVYRQIPPSIHFNKPNDKIDFYDLPVYVNTRLREWEAPDTPRRCGVNSFGISGTNCHVVLEEAPSARPSAVHKGDGLNILTLSAKSKVSLELLIDSYKSFAGKHPYVGVNDICYTANTGRGHYDFRTAIIIKDGKDFREKIEALNTIDMGSPRLPQEVGELNRKADLTIEKFIGSGSKDEELLKELCGLYISGAEIQWDKLYRDVDAKKVSIPTYQFDRKRCWVDMQKTGESSGKPEKEQIYYKLVWQKEALNKADSIDINGTVILLKGEKDICGETANHLRQDGNKVIEVESGDEKDFGTLLSTVNPDTPLYIVHMLTINANQEICSVEELRDSQNRGVYSLFHLIRAVLKSPLYKRTKIVLVSENVNEVTGKEICLRPENAALFGLGKVIGQEYPEVVCKAVDIDEFTGAGDILSELKANGGIYQAAYRNGTRYVEEFREADIEAAPDKKVEIKAGGVYVITGGTGGIGLEIARYLASKSRVKIALIGRSPMPEPELWPGILIERRDEKVCKVIETIMEIESGGTEVLYCRGDVSEIHDMTTAFNEIRKKFGKINGIVHCAGVAGKGFIIRKEEKVFNEVLYPKIFGTWVLNHLTEADCPDFFVLSSSGASIIGEPGQGDYTAANAYMDSFSAYRNKKGLKTLSVNWVIWESVGIGINHSLNKGGLLFKLLPAGKAIKAFDKVLNKDITGILIGEMNHESEMIADFSGKLFNISNGILGRLRHPGRNPFKMTQRNKSSTGAVQLKGKENGEYTGVEREIAEICREILGFGEMNIYDSFFELGADSILLKKMHVELDRKFPGKISVADIFAYTSIAKLSKHLNGNIEDRHESFQVESSGHKSDDIAIIGMAVNFPYASNTGEFWDVIINGIDCVTAFPQSRRNDIDDYLDYSGFWGGKAKYCEGAYLQEIDKFDYEFFRLTPKESSLMDPCQRLFMQTAWHAIEDSGYGGKKIVGTNTGVYIGFATTVKDSYQKIIADVEPSLVPVSVAANLPAMIPTRISYLLNLDGPTMAIDTACSSALVAVHLACQGIRNGDCGQAIAGGIKIHLIPVDDENTKIGIESSDGRTRAFDESSDGAGMGEGAAAVFLKPLQKAIEDRDNIYAVIKGSAINQDAKSIGITAPNPEAQANVITKVWKEAHIDPETISYIETHGTGTRLGDPIEIDGLTRAFRKYTNRKQFCAIGAVKSNIGHLYECAGMANLIKAVLALKYGVIPPTLHFKKPNREIRFENAPVYVNTRPRKWETGGLPGRCGVSSFGFSGTNCHMIIEGPPPGDTGGKTAYNGPHIFTLSARSEKVLKEMVREYIEFLDREKDLEIENICYTVNTGREYYDYRLAIIIESRLDLLDKLKKVYTGSMDNAAGEMIFLGKRNESAGGSKQEFVLSGKMHLERLRDICRIYVDGKDVDWEDLYGEHKIRKVSLPQYRFEKKRCWVSLPAARKEKKQTAENPYYYGVTWKQEEKRQLSQDDVCGSVLVFKGYTGAGERIAGGFKQAGQDVVEVEPGLKFERFTENRFEISAEEKDYDCLIQSLKDRNIGRVIHCMAITGEQEIKNLEDLEYSQQKGVYSLFYLVKAILKNGLRQPKIVLVADYVNEVTGAEVRINPENATLFGLGKVVRAEHPEMGCRCIDIDEFTDLDVIMGEINSPFSIQNTAYRKGVRYVEEFGSIQLERNNDRRFGIREHGVYIITGGTGGIGLEIAGFLASKNKVRLALVSRSKMPGRDMWDSILEEGSDTRMCKRIKAIREIEGKGSLVTCCSADVSNEKELSAVLEGVRDIYGAINGIFHCAGIGSNELLEARNSDDFIKVLAPKVRGTWIIEQLTQSDQLDFLVMSSSVASIFSALGQGDYVAANHYMDAFASFRNRRGKRTLTVNWSTWKETGMAVDYNFSIDTIFKAIPTARAIQALEDVMDSNMQRVLIGELNDDSDMIFMMEKYPFRLSDEINGKLHMRRLNFKEKARTEGAGDGGEIILHGKDNGEYSKVEISIAHITQEVLGYDEIDIYESFFEMGADSIMLKRLHTEVVKLFPGKVAITDIFEYPSVHRLSQYIADRCDGDELSGGKHTDDIDKELFNMLDEAEKGNLTADQIADFLEKI